MHVAGRQLSCIIVTVLVRLQWGRTFPLYFYEARKKRLRACVFYLCRRVVVVNSRVNWVTDLINYNVRNKFDLPSR